MSNESQINDYFLNCRTADKWKKIGIRRRAGVAVPLYSLYSQYSTGIGELTDLKLLADWCKLTGISIIQLLPLNDVGDDFAPYNSVSSYAVDPMYLTIKDIKHSDLNPFSADLLKLKKKYRQLFRKVNYKVKNAKINLLWNIYKSEKTDDISEYNNFKQKNVYWLTDYAVYKVISEQNNGIHWNNWESGLRNREPAVIESFSRINFERIEFHKWLQWQLYEQLRDVKKYLEEKEILLMGDLPFLVSGESADVWSHPEYFMLHLSSGAPPDMYFALGQKWGMPPYHWNNIANDGFTYLKEKLKYAEYFYDMYRIDHFVGLFRLWVSSADDTESPGSFMPADEYMWEPHGRRIIDEMVRASCMLPCAEDLGTVPGCSYHILNEYGIPGIDFQRYCKNNFSFRPPIEYRLNTSAVSSTHDSSFWVNWWLFEAGSIDEKLFEILCNNAGISEGHYSYSKKMLFDHTKTLYGRLHWKDDINSAAKLYEILQVNPDAIHSLIYAYMESYGEKQKYLNYLGVDNTNVENLSCLVKKNLEAINSSASIFSIQLLQDYLALDPELLHKTNRYNYRINTPGTVSKNNWSQQQPISLDSMLKMDINDTIKSIINASERL